MGLGGERGAVPKPGSDTSNSRESNVIIIRRPLISTFAKKRMGLRRARDPHDIFNEEDEKRDAWTACSSDWTDTSALECRGEQFLHVLI